MIEASEGREVSRQREWQLARLAKGLCQSCGVRERERRGVRALVYCEDCRARLNRLRWERGNLR